MILGIDHRKTQFQHAVLVVQKFDLFDWGVTSDQTANYIVHYLLNLEIYIGDDPEWANNPKCPGGPFLTTTDANSYYTGQYGTDWVFGVEAWCNMAGRYTTLVADYSSVFSS